MDRLWDALTGGVLEQGSLVVFNPVSLCQAGPELAALWSSLASAGTAAYLGIAP